MDEFWVDDSSATEHMMQDPGGLEEPGTSGKACGGRRRYPFPIAGYGCLRFPVDQGVRNVKGRARELALERVAHVPDLGQHNLFTMKRLAQSFDAPMRFYPADAGIRPRSGGKPLIFRLLEPEKRASRDQGSPSLRRV